MNISKDQEQAGGMGNERVSDQSRLGEQKHP